jgi:hypothetical protein
MSEPSHNQKIADVLRPILAEKEALIVRESQGNVTVTPLPSHVLRDTHARLYGYLLSANEQLSAGCSLFLFGILLAAIVCIGLAVGWWDELLGKDAADELRSVWLYQFLFAIAIGIPGYVYEVRGRMRYRDMRTELATLMQMENMDRDVLIATIQGDAELATVARYLKRDRHLTALLNPLTDDRGAS